MQTGVSLCRTGESVSGWWMSGWPLIFRGAPSDLSFMTQSVLSPLQSFRKKKRKSDHLGVCKSHACLLESNRDTTWRLFRLGFYGETGARYTFLLLKLSWFKVFASSTNHKIKVVWDQFCTKPHTITAVSGIRCCDKHLTLFATNSSTTLA